MNCMIECRILFVISTTTNSSRPNLAPAVKQSQKIMVEATAREHRLEELEFDLGHADPLRPESTTSHSFTSGAPESVVASQGRAPPRTS